MAYGIEVFNRSGKTLIDENSRQLQILKTGTMVPLCMGSAFSYSTNPFRVGGSSGSQAQGTIASGSSSNSLIFIRPKRTSGSRSGATLQVGIYLGKCDYTWTSTTATTVGQNFVYATPTVGNASINTFSSYLPYSFSNTVVNSEHTAETIGDAVGVYGNWASYSANSTLIVTNIEHHSGTTYKVYVNGTWSSSMPANTASRTIEKTVMFPHSGNSARFDAAWSSDSAADFTLEYKMGVLSNNAEESAGYGVEVYKSNGTDLAFSSNRENFQIKSITTGSPDMAASSTIGAFDQPSSLPIIYNIVEDPANFDDYWVLVSVSGSTAAFVQGNGQNSTGTNRRVIGMTTGYIFVYPGNGFFDNRSMGYVWTSGSSQSLGGSNNAGIAMAPMLATRYDSVPQVNQSSYVSDTWALDATRSLAIGKFV